MKRKNTLKTGLILAMFVTLATTAMNAQSRGGKQEPPTYAKLLEEMDANEDGKLAKDEVKGPLKENFSEIDTDEDGFISEEEFENAPKPKGRPRN